MRVERDRRGDAGGRGVWSLIGDHGYRGGKGRLHDTARFRQGRTHDISADGQRFLMIKEVDDPGQAALRRNIIVVQHWVEELKRLVPK
jgi:hypothetical protein